MRNPENFSTGEQEPPTFEETMKRISDLSGVTVYEKLNATNDKEAKAEFLSNPDLVHPNNEYGNLSRQEFSKNLFELNRLLDHIDEIPNLSSTQRHFAAIVGDEGIKKCNFLLSAYDYNHAQSPEEKHILAKAHQKNNEALYGKADEDTFVQILQSEIAKIDYAHLSAENRQIYEKMISQIGPLKPVSEKLYRPSQETVERFSDTIQDFFAPFLQRVPDKGNELFTPQELKNVFNDILANEFGSLDVGYHAEVTDKVSNVGVSHEDRIIKIPASPKSNYSTTRVKELVVHELGTHVYRAIPFLIEGNRDAFSQGLPGNETFDEGIAKCCEQAIGGEFRESGHEHYINIGLATFQHKNFREVFEIQSALKTLTGKKNTTTLNGIQRCFRGTGELPNNKDLAYYNGSNAVWHLIEENIDNPALLDMLFLSGKSDLSQIDQRRLLYAKKVGNL